MPNKSLSFLNKLAFVILVSILSATNVGAYDVTVTNDTVYECKVSVWTSHLIFPQNEGEVTLQPGQSHTWNTGSWCPCGFRGFIVSHGWQSLPMTNCSGTVATESGTFMFPCCWNLNYKVCKKSVDEYGFCKQ
jgi:hypothetical protein